MRDNSIFYLLFTKSNISQATLFLQFDLDSQNEVNTITTAVIMVALCLSHICQRLSSQCHSLCQNVNSAKLFLKVAKLKKETQLLHWNRHMKCVFCNTLCTVCWLSNVYVSFIFVTLT